MRIVRSLPEGVLSVRRVGENGRTDEAHIATEQGFIVSQRSSPRDRVRKNSCLTSHKPKPERDHFPSRLWFALSLYFRFVASPPRIWRSARFVSRTRRTFVHRARSKTRRRSVTSLCTVLLLLPKRAAVCLTVSPVAMM